MTERDIVKTTVRFDDGTVEPIDTIRYEDKIWLAPVWFDQIALKRKQPLLIVRIDRLPHQNWDDADYVLNTTMPRWIFWDGIRPLPKTDLEVQVRPDIWFDYSNTE